MKILRLFKPYRGMRREIYIIFIARTINAFGFLIFPFLTLLLNNKIGLSASQTGFYVALTGFLYAPASLIGGKISDTWGRKKVLILFELIASLIFFACVFIEPSMHIVFMLMAASFCFGLAGPSHDAMIADLTTPQQRQGAYSLSYLGFNLGFAIAQIIAGFLFRNHLRLMFLIDAGTALAGISLIAFFVPETHRPRLISGRESSDNPSGQSIFRVLLKKPVLIYFALAAFGYRFVYSQWQFMVPMHLEHNFPGQGAKLFGLLGSLNGLFVVIFTPLITAGFMKKSNLDRIIYAGLLFTIGFGMLGLFNTRTAFFVSVIIFTTGEILEAISNMTFIMNHTPETHRGRMSSVIPILMGMGFTVGPIVTGAILDRTSFLFSWVFAGSVVFISTIGMIFIRRIDRESVNDTNKSE